MALMTVKDVAAYCGTSDKTIWRRVERPTRVRARRLVRIRDEDLHRWIEGRTVAAWAPPR